MELSVDSKNAFYSTGRRKHAVARVWMMPGSGKILINHRDIDHYFGRATSKMILRQPLELTETTARWDIYVNVAGGGVTPERDAAAVAAPMTPMASRTAKAVGYLSLVLIQGVPFRFEPAPPGDAHISAIVNRFVSGATRGRR